MQFLVVKDLCATRKYPGWLRLRLPTQLSKRQALMLEDTLGALPWVCGVRVSRTTASVEISYDQSYKEEVLAAVAKLSLEDRDNAQEEQALEEAKKQLTKELVNHIMIHCLCPPWIHAPLDILEAFCCLGKVAGEHKRMVKRFIE